MWWHVSNAFRVNAYCNLIIRSDKIDEDSEHISINVSSTFIEDYSTNNVAGYVSGSLVPDSFIVFTAHYDHLGRMGKETCFYGANDNASGTVMMMDLARHFSSPGNKADYSIAFIALSGEEAGLKGSLYYADNPLFPLERIRMLINLDMVGTGSDGITIVNGKEFEKEFNLFRKINDDHRYLEEVKARGESCNSDHCPFYEKGVPSVFIYTRGDEFMEYHNVDDRPEELPLTEYEDLFKLLVGFTKALTQCQSSM
jgi:Zn-dependent M28 family amino/carboxypeptidase